MASKCWRVHRSQTTVAPLGPVCDVQVIGGTGSAAPQTLQVTAAESTVAA